MSSLRAALIAALLVCCAGCGPEDEPIGEEGFAWRSQPNWLVASRLKEVPPSYPLRFALLSDTHHPLGDPVFAEQREQMLALSPRPSFAVVIGDFVETGAAKEHLEYLKMLDGYPVPIFSVIGNHEQYPPNRPSYTLYHGPEDFAFDYAGSRFIAMNDIVLRRNGLTDAQIRWLEKVLDDPATPDRYLLIHAPPSILPVPWGPPPFFNLERLYELCERFGVKLVVSGHMHEFRHRLVNGVHYLTTGGGGGDQDPKLLGQQDPPEQAFLKHFLLVTLEKNGQSKVELIPTRASSPLSSFTIHFQTQLVP